ncbi:MAG: beta-galactosidase [Chloroflexi bacterium]|nr:beta-galactosidase [Chloroflexota bacterium]
MERRTISRRELLKLIGFGSLIATLFGYETLRQMDSLDHQDIVRPNLLGTTFSQLQCRYLGLDFRETFWAITNLGLDIVRLCTYWNEIEVDKGEFNFSTIDWIMEKAQEADWQIVLSVGMKTPRWPEFHFPRWVSDKYDISRTDIPLDSLPGLAEDALAFTHKVVEHLKQCSKIKYWQVENEALNRAPVAGGRYLSDAFVRREIELVKRLSSLQQGILFTFGIDPPFAIQSAELMIKPMFPVVDAVGFDVYVKVATGASIIDYVEASPPFWWNVKRWRDFVTSEHKEAWIAEAQAEPWEPNKLVAIEKRNYPSSDPERAIKLASRLTSLGFDPVLLWGCEHWYWHKRQGNNEWWDAVVQYVNAHKK